MAKITRQTHKLFGRTGPTDKFAKFGSLVAAVPLKTKDIATIQSLPAWDEGFQSSIFGANKDLLLQDLNSFCFEHSTQVAYLFQAGIAEWDAATEYDKGSFVQRTAGADATGQVYVSLIDANIGNAPPAGASNANWLWVNPPQDIIGAAATINVLPKVTNLAPANGVPGSVALSDSQVVEDGVNVKIGLPLKFPDATVQGTAAAPITAQANMTGFRALGTVYHNTSGKTLFVSVTIGQAGDGGDATAQAVTDANPAPTLVVAKQGVASTASVSPLNLFFIVLPGNYYKVSNIVGTYTMTSWIEWS